MARGVPALGADLVASLVGPLGIDRPMGNDNAIHPAGPLWRNERTADVAEDGIRVPGDRVPVTAAAHSNRAVDVARALRRDAVRAERLYLALQLRERLWYPS